MPLSENTDIIIIIIIIMINIRKPHVAYSKFKIELQIWTVEIIYLWWWWLLFYGHFFARGRLNGPSDLQR